MYEWKELINLWERAQITSEQARPEGSRQLMTHGEAQAALERGPTPSVPPPPSLPIRKKPRR